MKKIYRLILLLGIGIGLINCSTQLRLLKKHQYAELIKEANSKLDDLPDDRRAGKLLQKTYQKALIYSQEELDKIQNQNDQLKHKKMIDLMMKMDSLSDLIRKNPYALHFIPKPKIYRSEIAELKPLAVEELYAAATDAFNQKSREKAKEAFNCFYQLVWLDPDFKDVKKKITEAKNRATINVILDDVQFYLTTLNLSAEKFQKELLYRLQYEYPYLGFINFYSSDEALKSDINSPEMVIKLEIRDFRIEQNSTRQLSYSPQQPSKKLEVVGGKYTWTDVPKENNPGDPGSNGIYVYRADFSGTVSLHVFSTREDKMIYRDKVFCTYQYEKSSTSSDGGFHQLVIGPESQAFFDDLFISNIDQIVDHISAIMQKYK